MSESWPLQLFFSSLRGFPGGSDGKESACNAGDPGLINGYHSSILAWRIPWALSLTQGSVSRSVVSDSLHVHGLLPTRLLHPWNSPGKTIAVGGHFLLQGMFPTQGLNLGLLHQSQDSLLSESPGKPNYNKIDRNNKEGWIQTDLQTFPESLILGDIFRMSFFSFSGSFIQQIMTVQSTVLCVGMQV